MSPPARGAPATLSLPADVVLLDAVAAAACPVKVRRAYEGGPGPVAAEVDQLGGPAAVERERQRERFVTQTLDRWVGITAGVVDLRPVSDSVERWLRTASAMRAGRSLIVGPALPIDPAGHRSGSPDALLRTAGDGPVSYLPVLIRWHKILRRRRPMDDDGKLEPVPERPRSAELDRPDVPDSMPIDLALRLETRLADFIQLAHHRRLLAAAGFAGEPWSESWGAVIGTDQGPDRPLLTWIELDRPIVRVVDKASPAGWRLATLLERADQELARRLAVADAVRPGSRRPGVRPEQVVLPVVIDECRTCRWWPACRAELDPDDLSLRIARGRLDRIEITALRSLELGTVAELAGADVDAVLPTYLPEVAHRADAEPRVRALARRARMLVSGQPIERETGGPIEVPRGSVEIDLDIETSAAGRIYLWGFCLRNWAVDEGDDARYVAFARFEELDEAAELALAREALGWLRAQVAAAEVRVFHYSGYEVAMIEALAAREPADELLAWTTAYARAQFVDLLEIVQRNFFGAEGLGLKQIAVAAGFGWRDSEPGGLNSQRWFEQAVHDPDADVRRSAERRVLAYNEDDVRATAHLRGWLRGQ